MEIKWNLDIICLSVTDIILKVTAGKNTPTLIICRRATVNIMGMSSKDSELVVHYDSELNRPIWGGCMVKETGLSTAKNNSTKIQRLASVCIMVGGRGMRSCPKADMEVLLHITHLDLQVGMGNTIETSKNFPREKLTFGALQSIWKLPRDLLWSGNMFLEENFNAY